MKKQQRIKHNVNTLSKQLVKTVIFYNSKFKFIFIFYTSTPFSRFIDIRLVKDTVLSSFHLDIRYLSQLF